MQGLVIRPAVYLLTPNLGSKYTAGLSTNPLARLLDPTVNLRRVRFFCFLAWKCHSRSSFSLAQYKSTPPYFSSILLCHKVLISFNLNLIFIILLLTPDEIPPRPRRTKYRRGVAGRIIAVALPDDFSA